MDSSGASKDQPPEDGVAGKGDLSSTGARAVRPSDVNDAPRALAGKTIGRYRLLYPIAAGGMAQVWAAKPEGGGLSRTVAIKLVRPEYAADEEYSRMFIDEAMVASSIHHPNVCEIYELGRDGDLLFMVLEWVAGDSLSGIVQRGSELNPLANEVAARIVAEACAGLHAAHDAIGPDGQPLGIVHRDISPPNILISVHGHVKVSDFGIAKARHQLHSRTRTGEIKGKFAYIPPEQILGKGVDRRADIYAMGCVLYMASLGLRPFGGGASALGKIVQGKFRLPRDLRPDYPPELEAIIVKALATNPATRYQTAEEMRTALDEWLLTASQFVGHADVSRVVRERMNPERRRLVEAVLSSSRALPEALAYQLLAHQDKTDTPTATSGLVMQPPGLRKKLKDQSRQAGHDPDATLVGAHAELEASNQATESEEEPSLDEQTRVMLPSSPGGSVAPVKPAEAARAASAKAASARPTARELNSKPAAAQPGREPNSRPASARPAGGEPSSKPASARPATAGRTKSSAAPRSASKGASIATSGLASLPPTFRQNRVDGWVWWMFGLAATLAAGAYFFNY